MNKLQSMQPGIPMLHPQASVFPLFPFILQWEFVSPPMRLLTHLSLCPSALLYSASLALLLDPSLEAPFNHVAPSARLAVLTICSPFSQIFYSPYYPETLSQLARFEQVLDELITYGSKTSLYHFPHLLPAAEFVRLVSIMNNFRDGFESDVLW